MVQQLCRGVAQYMVKAKINLRDISKPKTLGEIRIYEEFKQKLQDAAIPFVEVSRPWTNQKRKVMQ